MNGWEKVQEQKNTISPFKLKIQLESIKEKIKPIQESVKKLELELDSLIKSTKNLI